jgi:hypothetical protein
MTSDEEQWVDCPQPGYLSYTLLIQTGEEKEVTFKGGVYC